MSIEALIWAFGIGFLVYTTEKVGPSPRALITAFPALIVAVTCVRRRGFVYLSCICAVLLLAASWATLMVRPHLPGRVALVVSRQAPIPQAPLTREILPP